MARNPKITRANETGIAPILVAFALGALLCYALLSIQKPSAIFGQSLNSVPSD